MSGEAAPLDRDIADALSEVGIYEPDPENELHRRLVDALYRTRGQILGARYVAMQWVFDWDLGRHADGAAEAESDYARISEVRRLELGTEAAKAKDAWQNLRGSEIVRVRDAGERNAEIAGMRADLVEKVRAAFLEKELAELRAKNAESDDQVAAARSRRETTKALVSLAKSRAYTIANQIKVWQSLNANQRAADRAHVHGVGGGA